MQTRPDPLGPSDRGKTPPICKNTSPPLTYQGWSMNPHSGSAGGNRQGFAPKSMQEVQLCLAAELLSFRPVPVRLRMNSCATRVNSTRNSSDVTGQKLTFLETLRCPIRLHEGHSTCMSSTLAPPQVFSPQTGQAGIFE